MSAWRGARVSPVAADLSAPRRADPARATPLARYRVRSGGKHSEMLVPESGSLSITMRPPCSSTIVATSGKPRPVLGWEVSSLPTWPKEVMATGMSAAVNFGQRTVGFDQRSESCLGVPHGFLYRLPLRPGLESLEYQVEADAAPIGPSVAGDRLSQCRLMDSGALLLCPLAFGGVPYYMKGATRRP